VLAVINHIFPAENESVEYLRGIPVEKQAVSEVNINVVSDYCRFLHKTFNFSNSFKRGELISMIPYSIQHYSFIFLF
jgi:hypothetical protein